MRIYDCFTFHNETDLLELRLHELCNLAHRFVLVESHFTHQGNPKPLYYLENKDRFERFNDKIIHVVEDFHDTAPDPWARENAQRNRISAALENAGVDDQDFVIVSDLDEIPRAARISSICSSLESKPDLQYLHMKLYYYYLNCEFTKIRWSKGFVAPWSLLRGVNLTQVRKSYTEHPRILPVLGRNEIVESTLLPGQMTERDHQDCIKDNFAGWHFGYIGGAARIMEKLQSFAHAEFNNEKHCNQEHIALAMKKRTGIIGDDTFDIVPIDDSYPRYVLDNLDLLKQKGYVKP
jgi:hypothetical protein